MQVHRLVLGAVVLAAGCNGKLTTALDPGAVGAAGQGNVVAGAGEMGIAGQEDLSIGGHGNFGAGGSVRDPSVGGNPPALGGWPSGGQSGSSGSGAIYPAGAGGRGGTAGSSNRGGSGGDSMGADLPPAELGEQCTLWGTLDEAEGTPASAKIFVPRRCAEGLDCANGTTCVPAPDCPNGYDECVVRHAALSAAGVGGAGNTPGSSLGYGGATVTHTDDGSIALSTIERTGVVAMAASDSRVYWIEYGTRDSSGNYQHDGALLTYSKYDQTTSVIASGLEGPIAVELTTSHAYIYVDGGQALGSLIHAQLFRVPLIGGTAVLVQDNVLPSSFAAADTRAFWNTDSSAANPKIYTMTAAPNAVPTEFVSGNTYALASDGDNLFYGTANGLMRSPVASPAPVALGASATEFVPYGTGLYRIETTADGGVLSSAPLSGGEFLPIQGLGSGAPSRMRRVGDRYFFESEPVKLPPTGLGYRRLLTAGFVMGHLTQLLQRPNRLSSVDHLWAVTKDALFWSDGQKIYTDTSPLTALQ